MKRILIHSNHKDMSQKVKTRVEEIIKKTTYEIVGFAPDLIIVIGGDGTMLSAIKKFRYSKVPFLGINTGTLGFLPTLVPKDLNQLVDILDHKKYIEHHFPLLKLTCITNKGKEIHDYSFNEILVKHVEPKLMEAKIFFNGKPFNYFTGDGFIISTPVGATGYAIWAGGVATHTDLNIYQVTPIHPNDNSINRPLKTSMIVPDQTEMKIEIVNSRNKVIVASDGKKSTDDYIKEVYIQKSKDHIIKILKTDDFDYFDLYRNKIIDKKIVKSL